ncbi:MAG: WG repeat-containing protein [Bacteroidota bacterium]
MVFSSRAGFYRSLFVVFILCLASCSTDTSRTTELFPVQAGGTYQYIDRSGKVAIAPQFVEASCFYEGIALVATGNDSNRTWGYIGTNGKYIAEPKYTEATTFSEGTALVVAEGSAPAAIDKEGKVVFTLPDAEQVDNYCEGYAAYSVIGEQGERWGFVNMWGKQKIAPQYAMVGGFAENLCSVMNDEGKWGFIDKDGKVAVPCKYENVSVFLGNSARVQTEGKWGTINSVGSYLIKPAYDNMEADGGAFVVQQNGKWGWVDRSAKTIIPFEYDDALPFNGSDYTAVRRGDKWGYINKKGKEIIAPQFEFAFGFDGDMALIGQGRKYGFVKKDGKVAIAPQYKQVSIDYIISYFGRSTAYNGVRTDANNPKHIAYRWLTDFYHLRYDEAKEVSSDDTRVLLEQFSGLTGYMNDSSRKEMMKVKVGIKDVHDEGSTANVVYHTSDNPGKDQVINLIKNADGQWRVQFSKNDIVGGGQPGAVAGP